MQKNGEGGITMAGRKPKPTAIKKLEGNPGKRKLNTKEPAPVKGMPTCPEWLFLQRVLPLRLIKDISSRHLGLVLQIQIRN